MKNILVIGAGRTAASLINYLKNKSKQNDWLITIADISLELAKQRAGNHPKIRAIKFNVFNEKQRAKEIANANVIISLLPESMHINLVPDCIKNKVHLLTASYISKEMKEFNKEAVKRGIILLNEMGLDPGIDHMETMRIINYIKQIEGRLISLKSYGGGLIAPEYDTNPWRYKITWNPMNVVIAGMASARYVKDGKLKVVPYNRLFLDTEIVEVPGAGKFEAYPNRDSIKYRKIYHVPNIPNVYRGSLRRIGFCKAWNALVKIGLTDNRYFIPDSHQLTYKDFLSIYLKRKNGEELKSSLCKFLNERSNSKVIKKIEWLGLLSSKKITVKNGSPAEILLKLLEEKWKFGENDKDMVILHTEVEFKLKRKTKRITSSLVTFGKDSSNTAMSDTVGLPLGIGVNLILNNKIKERGVIMPIYPDIYKPALKELAEIGIKPKEIIEELD